MIPQTFLSNRAKCMQIIICLLHRCFSRHKTNFNMAGGQLVHQLLLVPEEAEQLGYHLVAGLVRVGVDSVADDLLRPAARTGQDNSWLIFFRNPEL